MRGSTRRVRERRLGSARMKEVRRHGLTLSMKKSQQFSLESITPAALTSLRMALTTLSLSSEVYRSGSVPDESMSLK